MIQTRKSFIKKCFSVMCLMAVPAGARDIFSRKKHPRKKCHITPERWRDGSWALEAPGGKTFFLNHTGKDIWELADGTRTENEITMALSARYGEPEDIISPSVSCFIISMKEQGLLA